MTLVQIAMKMTAEAHDKGNAHRTLQRDLRLTLYERENDLVLCISRPTALVVPSEREIDICQKAFFGDQTLKIVNGQTHVWSERKCYLAVEKGKKINALP